MIDWWILFSTSFIVFLIYFGFFWKINYVRHFDSKKNGRIARGRFKNIDEMNPVYPNGWFGILESSQLAKGQVKHVSALGENFAVFRPLRLQGPKKLFSPYNEMYYSIISGLFDPKSLNHLRKLLDKFRTEEGKVHILDAYCPHLGANMAESGKVIGNCLECPFHKWKFSGDGECLRIPYSDKIPANSGVKTWKSREVNHFIFVWYHAESEEPDWEIEPKEQIENGSWWYQGRNEFTVSCHIQDIPENGADWAHLAAVHGAGMVTGDILPKVLHHAWPNTVWSTLAFNNIDDSSSKSSEGKLKLSTEKYRATLSLNHQLILFDKYPIVNLHVKVSQIGPAYVELAVNTRLGPMFMVQSLVPIEPLVQRVTHLMFSPPLIGPYTRFVLFGACLMFDRDVDVWNHKKYLKNPVLVSEDKTIKTFRRWYEQFYSPNSPTYRSIKSLEW